MSSLNGGSEFVASAACELRRGPAHDFRAFKLEQARVVACRIVAKLGFQKPWPEYVAAAKTASLFDDALSESDLLVALSNKIADANNRRPVTVIRSFRAALQEADSGAPRLTAEQIAHHEAA